MTILHKGAGVESLGHWHIDSGTEELFNHFGKWFAHFLQILICNYGTIQQLSSGFIQKKWNVYAHAHTHVCVHKCMN